MDNLVLCMIIDEPTEASMMCMNDGETFSLFAKNMDW